MAETLPTISIASETQPINFIEGCIMSYQLKTEDCNVFCMLFAYKYVALLRRGRRIGL